MIETLRDAADHIKLVQAVAAAVDEVAQAAGGRGQYGTVSAQGNQRLRQLQFAAGGEDPEGGAPSPA